MSEKRDSEKSGKVSKSSAGPSRRDAIKAAAGTAAFSAFAVSDVPAGMNVRYTG